MSAQQMQQYHILCNLLTIRLKWDRTVSKSQPQLETAREQITRLRKLLNTKRKYCNDIVIVVVYSMTSRRIYIYLRKLCSTRTWCCRGLD